MDALDYEYLCQQAAEWKHQASDLDFLGEIALPQTRLDQILITLGRYHRRVDEPNLSFVLAVAAVNWAYWRGVDEEESKSFRESFMTHSLGYCDLRAWENAWGPAIESAICDWSKQPPRFGAYRYVGLILRHAGVPHAKIPKLAQLLQDIDRNIGWPNVPTVRDREIQDYATSFFGTGCIGEHLASDAGIAYLRSLCADLTLLRSRSPQKACDLPGYRPGLLPALLENLVLGPRTAAPQTFPLPYVTLDFANGRIELVFDERLVRGRSAIHCDQWERRLFDARLDLGPGGVEPGSTYSGRLPDGRSWSVKGWQYNGADAWALFRTDGRLVTTQSHDEPVSTGNYVLAHVAKYDVGTLWPDAGDDGERFLPDGTECRLWHLQLREGDDDKLPKLRITTSVHPWIECVNPGSLTALTGFDAVCCDAPVIRVGGWTGRNSRRFRLTVSTLDGQHDLHPATLSTGEATVTLTELPIGAVCDLSLVPVGFQHGPRITQVVRIVRFPGSVEVETGLWPLGHEATLRVSVSEGLQLEADECAAIVGTGSQLHMIVPPNATWVSLRVLGHAAQLPLQVAVRRCAFSLSDSPAHSAIFNRALLRQMCDPESSRATFVISAIPGRTVDLVARDRYGASRVWRRGLKLGSNGRLELPATELVDVTRNETGILEMIVRCDGFDVPTGALFVEPSLGDLEAARWPVLIEQYLQVIRQPLVTLDGLELLAEVTCLWRNAVAITMVDFAFGLSLVSPSAPHIAPGIVEWVSGLKNLLLNRPTIAGLMATEWKTGLLAWLEQGPLSIRPPRWEAAVRTLIAELERKIDIAGPVARLLAGYADPAVPDGLAHGWKCYAEAGKSSQTSEFAFLQANAFFSTASRGAFPWSAVAQRLSAWTMLRAGAVIEFPKIVGDFASLADWPGLTELLQAVACLMAMERPSPLVRDPGGFELSSREDDRLLASAIKADDAVLWMKAAANCWLSSWFAWRWSLIIGLEAERREEFRAGVLKHLDEIPTRALDIVTEDLRSGVPRRLTASTELK